MGACAGDAGADQGVERFGVDFGGSSEFWRKVPVQRETVSVQRSESREQRTDETRSNYYVAEWDRPGLVERLKLGVGMGRVMVMSTPTSVAQTGPALTRDKTKPIYYVHHNSSSAPYLPSLSCTIRYLYSPQPCG